MRTYNIPVKNYFPLLIIVLIGFQQFPVVRVGGSFKLYELLALGLLITDLIYIKQFKFYATASLFAFGFFVISPIFSYLYANLFLGYPTGFYLTYPGADSFKYNFYVFPFLQLIYMFFNFSAINAIIGSSYIYENFNKVVKYIIITGTCISIYSLIAMGTVDVIRLLPSFIQNKSEFFFRSCGLSQEPSFYVLYQTWICLFTAYSKNLFSKIVWWPLLMINVLSLVATFSTTLVGLVLIIILSVFYLRSSLKRRFGIIALASIFIGGVVMLIYALELSDLFDTLFVNKISNFFSSPNHTMDSGGFRSYTTGIGFKIFSDHLLTGVGVGNSIYYMYLFENKMGIISFGETLQPGSFPQNLFSIVLSEQGIIGGLLLVGFLSSCIRKLWKFRNETKYNNMFLIGAFFNVIAMLTIAPVYSLFIWVFFAFGMGYIKHVNLKNTPNHIPQ